MVMERETILKMRGIVKRYGDFTAVDHVDFSMHKGEIVAIIGPSGSGKSTLLRCINGLNSITEGEIELKGTTGMVFQHFNLFPHMTCRENITYAPIKVKKEDKAEVEKKADSLLKMVGLENKGDVYPAHISGGQKQRVAIARALANNPDVLLMDEPFGALDPQTKASMQLLLRQIWQKQRTTVVFVTHDIEEAVFLATKIYVMSARPGTVKNEIPV